jgi:hypothetical protein
MGTERCDSPVDAAKEALSLAMNGDTNALKNFIHDINSDSGSSLKNDAGQMNLVVQAYEKRESEADKKILPQLSLNADGHSISVKAPVLAADDEVATYQKNIADMDAASKKLDQGLGQISTATPGFEKVIDPQGKAAYSAIQTIRESLVANEEKAIQNQVRSGSQ